MFNLFNKNNKEQEAQQYRPQEFVDKSAEIKMANLESQFETMKGKKEFYEKEFKKLKGLTETFCKSVMSNQYNMSQLGGTNVLETMDIFKLIDFAKLDYQKQKIEQIETIKKMNEQLKVQSMMIENLKQQLTQAMLQNNRDISMEEVENATIIDNAEILGTKVEEKPIFKIEKDGVGHVKERTVSTPTPSVQSSNYNRTEVVSKEDTKKQGGNKLPELSLNKQDTSSKTQGSPLVDLGKSTTVFSSHANGSSDSPLLTIENVEAYMSGMTDAMWEIVDAMGTKGFAVSNDIIDYLEKQGSKWNKSNILNSISMLKKMNVISADTISTGYRRFQIFKLSTKGIEMFKAYFKKEPVESEIDGIIRDHDNVIHGYTIKDTCELLLQYHGVKDLSMDREKVSIKLQDGKTYIPDIIATSKDGEKMYIEVELGNTPQKDFNNKCKKMMEVTKNFYIVTDVDDTIKKKLEGQVSMWILNMGGKEKIEGITIYITTMTQLSKGEWSKVLKY